jgi:hypothetical protein
MSGTIGPYEVLEELGRGGMGLVFRARHAPTGAVRALKVLAGGADAEAVVRFQREAQALARVGGRGIVPVHHSGTDGGRLWFAMELYPGGSLRARLRREGKLPWREAASLVAKLADALARCHAAGVIHRDVKPDNVLLDDAGEPWVADFGAVRDLGASRLTETGTSLGTISYMSPEQLEGQSVDARTDVYGLGVVLFEAVAGARPFEGTSVVAHLAARAEPRPRLAGEGAPPELDGILDRALALDRGRRTASASELARELEGLVRANAPEERRAPERAGLPRALALGVVASVALLAAVLLRAAGRRASTPEDSPVAPQGPRPMVQKPRAVPPADLEKTGDAALQVGNFKEARAAFRDALEAGREASRRRLLLANLLLDPRSIVELVRVLAPDRAGNEDLRTFAPILYRRGLELRGADDAALVLHGVAWRLDEPREQVSELVAFWRRFAATKGPETWELAEPRRISFAERQRSVDRLLWAWRAHETDPGGDPASLWLRLAELRTSALTVVGFAEAVLEVVGGVAAEHPTFCLLEARRCHGVERHEESRDWALRGLGLLPPPAAGEDDEVAQLAGALVDAVLDGTAYIEGPPAAGLVEALTTATERAPTEDRWLGIAYCLMRVKPLDAARVRAYLERGPRLEPVKDTRAALEVELLEAEGNREAALERAWRWSAERPASRSRHAVMRNLEALHLWSRLLESFDVKLEDGVDYYSRCCLGSRLIALFRTQDRAGAEELAKKFPLLQNLLEALRREDR